jgi:hypothetical protein
MSATPHLCFSVVPAEPDMPSLDIAVPLLPPFRLGPHEVKRFGRGPDVDIALGEHRTTMSRHVGTLYFGRGCWWVENPAKAPGRRGTTIDLVMADGSCLPVFQGQEAQLHGSGRIKFPPGGQIDFRVVTRVHDTAPAEGLIEPADGTDPIMPLWHREVDYIVALAEPEIIGDPMLRRPHLSEVADIWGVQRKTVDANLLRVRQRLVEYKLLDGIEGKSGENDVLARVAAHHRLVTVRDLAWARLHDPLKGPRRSDAGPRFKRRSP